MTTKRTSSTIAGRSLDLSGLGREESDLTNEHPMKEGMPGKRRIVSRGWHRSRLAPKPLPEDSGKTDLRRAKERAEHLRAHAEMLERRLSRLQSSPLRRGPVTAGELAGIPRALVFARSVPSFGRGSSTQDPAEAEVLAAFRSAVRAEKRYRDLLRQAQAAGGATKGVHAPQVYARVLAALQEDPALTPRVFFDNVGADADGPLYKSRDARGRELLKQEADGRAVTFATVRSYFRKARAELRRK